MASTPTMTLPNYCALLVKSKLIPSETIKDQFELWQSRNSGSDDLDAFRKFLVKGGFLSEYQSVMLTRGHADGFQLDQYTIQDRIGKGRMAGVFKAIHATGQVVAIKVLPPSSAKEPMLLSRFQREAKLLIKLDHPNVVRAYQFGESGGKHYFAMEYLEGETLDDILQRRGKLPPAEAVQIVYQAMRGLEHLFARNMVHRDIKPANLILIPAVGSSLAENTLKATVKLLDIGLGKSFFDEHAVDQETQTQLTSEGVLLGTPDYMAPEQAKNASTADIRADIYSLGCVLYHCLTGQPPFPDNNLMNQIIRHATEPVKPLKNFINPVPEGLQAVLDYLLAKDVEKRYQTPEKAAQALKLFLKHLPEVPAAPAPSPKFLKWLQQASTPDEPVEAASAVLATKAKPAMPPSGVLVSKAKPLAPASDVLVSKAKPPAPPSGVLVSKAKPLESPSGVLASKAKESGPLARPPAKPKTETVKSADTILAPAATPKSESWLETETVDVELIPLDELEENRGLFEFNRRDAIMIGMGAAAALLAAGIGYTLSRRLKKDHE